MGFAPTHAIPAFPAFLVAVFVVLVQEALLAWPCRRGEWLSERRPKERSRKF